MKNTLETRIGLFVALVVLAAVFLLDIVGGPEQLRRGYRLLALFQNVQELKVGDRVKMAGVEIGRVEDLQLTNGMVLVTMKLRRNAEVKTDSTATVKFAGLMGQNYVSINYGTLEAPALENNQFISTVEQPDLSAIMTKLDNVASGVENLTKSFTGDKIDNLLGPFTDFLKANREPLTATISNLKAISAQISSGEGTVGKLIYDNSLHDSALATVTNIESASTDMKLALGDARRVIEQINAGQGTVGKLIKDDRLYNETTDSMTNLKEILQKINQGQGSIGKLVNEQEFYKNAKLTLQKLDKAMESLEDTGPLTVLGIAVNSLL
jgi:phospholipid/cholesterol/gamma-HCH transport system substrate-binding protein